MQELLSRVSPPAHGSRRKRGSGEAGGGGAGGVGAGGGASSSHVHPTAVATVWGHGGGGDGGGGGGGGGGVGGSSSGGVGGSGAYGSHGGQAGGGLRSRPGSAGSGSGDGVGPGSGPPSFSASGGGGSAWSAAGVAVPLTPSMTWGGGGEERPASIRNPGRISILVVDDSNISSKLAMRKLVALGHDTMHAENGQVALELLRRFPADFDLVLLDIVMPVMDGIELLTVMQHDMALRCIPIVMLSGLEDEMLGVCPFPSHLSVTLSISVLFLCFTLVSFLPKSLPLFDFLRFCVRFCDELVLIYLLAFGREVGWRLQSVLRRMSRRSRRQFSKGLVDVGPEL
ncbi:unnamed protein product [Phaeothamnion confervicola]